jgi:hypothetical protein
MDVFVLDSQFTDVYNGQAPGDDNDGIRTLLLGLSDVLPAFG